MKKFEQEAANFESSNLNTEPIRHPWPRSKHMSTREGLFEVF